MVYVGCKSEAGDLNLYTDINQTLTRALVPYSNNLLLRDLQFNVKELGIIQVRLMSHGSESNME